MHIFHSHENIKTCMFTAFHSSEYTRFDIFTGAKTVRLELLFSIISIWSKGGNSGISVSFLRETTIGVSYKQKVRVA